MLNYTLQKDDTDFILTAKSIEKGVEWETTLKINKKTYSTAKIEKSEGKIYVGRLNLDELMLVTNVVSKLSVFDLADILVKAFDMPEGEDNWLSLVIDENIEKECKSRQIDLNGDDYDSSELAEVIEKIFDEGGYIQLELTDPTKKILTPINDEPLKDKNGGDGTEENPFIINAVDLAIGLAEAMCDNALGETSPDSSDDLDPDDCMIALQYALFGENYL